MVMRAAAGLHPLKLRGIGLLRGQLVQLAVDRAELGHEGGSPLLDLLRRSALLQPVHKGSQLGGHVPFQ